MLGTSLVEEPPVRSAEAQLEQLAQLNRRLEAVLSIAQIVETSPDLSDFFEEALTRLLHVMELDAGSLFLLDDAGETLELQASVGFSERYMEHMATVKVSSHAPGKAAKDGRPVVASGPNLDRLLSPCMKRDEGVLAYVAVPIRTSDGIIGVLDVACRKARGFDDDDLNLLNAVGSQISVAIQNAQLYERTTALAVAEERNWLAREMHDTLAQGLIALTIQLELADTALKSSSDVASAIKSIQSALRIARENLEEARLSVAYLRGDILERPPLPDALANLAQKVSENTGVVVSFLFPKHLKRRFPVNIEEALLRVATEALNNVWKHAHAKRVHISLKRRRNSLYMTIKDDGVGFYPLDHMMSSAEGHVGILGMHERIRRVGGQLEVKSRPGRGTSVQAVVPLGASNHKKGAVV
jgi:two-component system NarL family sensor kinase